MDNTAAVGRSVPVEGVNIHYIAAGQGEPVVLLHGWPTSSYLWRNIIGPLAKTRQVIVPDLVGFGKSDKPLDAPYTFGYQAEVVDGFLRALGVGRVSLVVHDVGGPIGALWAVRNPERVERLAILDTFLLPEISIDLRLVLLSSRTPGLNGWLMSPAGIALVMRLGVIHQRRLTSEVLAAYQAPFATAEARQVLLKTINAPQVSELEEVARGLPRLAVSMRIIYGQQDFLLSPDMRRLSRALPHAPVTTLPRCGHFLQEDQPERVSELLAEFLSP